MQSEVTLKNYQDLPKPDLESLLQLDSDSAQVANAGLVHIYKLPKTGTYYYNFRLWSNILLLNGYQTQQNTNLYEVDCILNYIESISLSIDTPESILSQVTNVETVHQLQKELEPIVGLNLNFLPTLPLIQGSLYHSDIYLVIKFRTVPKFRYYIDYQVGFITDPNLQTQLRTLHYSIPGQLTNGGVQQNCLFKYGNGKLQVV